MTVSRFFNKPELLSTPTRNRVAQAVEQLGYVPNHAARSLVRGETRTLALIVADITNPFFTRLARGVEDAAQEAGYTLMLGNTDETAEKEGQYVHALIARRVDGVLLAPHNGAEHVKQLCRHDIPTVLIDRKVPSINVDTLTSDSYDGGRQLVHHLVAQGYERIAFIGGQRGVSSLEERLAGYRAAMEEAGLAPRVHLGAYTRESGATITEALLTEDVVPEALVAANNFVAVGAYTVLHEHGFDVPADMALTGFGDLGVIELIDPFLTVISQPAYEMGRRALGMLLERIQGFSGPAREETLPVQLITRRSTQQVGLRDQQPA